MNVSIRLMIDDHTKDSANLIINDVLLNANTTILDLQNSYKQSHDNEIYVICRGELVCPNLSLSEIGLCDGSCIKLVIKRRAIKQEILFNEDSVKEIIKKHHQMMKTRFKQVISESLEKGLDNVIDNETGLERDLLAYSIASDYRLLRTLLGSTENVSKLLRRCPVLIPAALRMINIIQEKLRRVAGSRNQESQYFSLGQVEQSEDSSEDEEEPEVESRTAAAPISRSQLREAISGVARPPEPSSAGPVSLAQLRTAIETAIGTGGVQAEPMEVDGEAGSSGASDTELKVRSLIAMGFTDRSANEGALTATGGDLATAIELLLTMYGPR